MCTFGTLSLWQNGIWSKVYESNHETTLAAVLIHGPCEVLPRKFSEERVIQTNSQIKTFDKPKRFFLCGYRLKSVLLILRSNFKNVKQE
ncbi:hypothetical protein L1987_24377 [Smallanthus sonchifolius]|uniref:Uncharacterized protein n=1 Tax=Smallanthus sonchifolius TaxID=185202 RepID=A0ACB9ILR9_9ASTR|nr:hypothetical protein L1987_24377 [Smallanthus sonchifolius]